MERIQAGKEMLVRIVAILTKLVERFDPDQYRVRENASGVAQSFEHEDDDEHEHEERQKAKGRRQKLFVGPPTRLLRSAFPRRIVSLVPI